MLKNLLIIALCQFYLVSTEAHIVGESAWCIGYDDIHFECHFEVQPECERNLKRALPINFQDELTGTATEAKKDEKEKPEPKKVTRYCTPHPQRTVQPSANGNNSI